MFKNKVLSPIKRDNNLLFRNTKKSQTKPILKPTVATIEKKESQKPLSMNVCQLEVEDE